MVVGVMKLNLILPENHSLKGKRSVLRRVQARVIHRFHISVTECGNQDLWHSAILGFGVVGSSQKVVDATLQKVIHFVDQLKLGQVGETEIEIFHV